MKPRIVMLLSASGTADPRVAKEAEALVAGGYEVVVLAWDREKRDPAIIERDGWRIRRPDTAGVSATSPAIGSSGAKRRRGLPRSSRMRSTATTWTPFRPRFRLSPALQADRSSSSTSGRCTGTVVRCRSAD
jgi:hypothetical protein